MTDLYPYSAPDGVELLVKWLKDIAECRTDRPTGAVLPWITVRRIGGGDDGLTDRGLYSIHCFDETKLGAQQLSRTMHSRMCALVLGQRPVTISTGTHYVDSVTTMEHPRAVEYLPSRICRVVGTYRMGLRATVNHALQCIIMHNDADG